MLSLREALTAAGTANGPVIIDFDASNFVSGYDLPTAIVLAERLEFAGTNAEVTIDGSLAGSFYNVRIQAGSDGDRLMTVDAGATLTLRELVFTGGKMAL